MNVGDEWIYRLRDYAPSERVRILAIQPKKTSVRADVEFLDGDKAGHRENVPGVRLKRLWRDVAAYDAEMANWESIDGYDLSETEDFAMTSVICRLIPEEVAEIEGRPVRNAISIRDRGALEQLIGLPVRELLTEIPHFEEADIIYTSAEAGLLIAEAACKVNPMPVLHEVMKEEAEIRERCKRGANHTNMKGEEYTSDPEWEYAWYRKCDKPRHELLRQWCGHRAVTFQERLDAAEAEVRRLDILIAEVIDSLRQHNTHSADAFDRRHNDDRITAETIRPVPDRPLAPHEIPVQIVYKRGRRWH